MNKTKTTKHNISVPFICVCMYVCEVLYNIIYNSIVYIASVPVLYSSQSVVFMLPSLLCWNWKTVLWIYISSITYMQSFIKKRTIFPFFSISSWAGILTYFAASGAGPYRTPLTIWCWVERTQFLWTKIQRYLPRTDVPKMMTNKWMKSDLVRIRNDTIL